MTDKVYVVGAYVPLTAEYRTLAAAAERDYRDAHGEEGGVAFVVYQSGSGDAVVEVSRGGPFRTAGFYKLALVEVGAADAR